MTSNNKPGINPVTIRSTIPNQPEVVIGRLGVGIGSGKPADLTVQILVIPRGTDPKNIAKAQVPVAIIPQAMFIAALGHLFPAGELARAHFNE